MVRWVSRTCGLWLILGLAIPAALGGLLTLSWTGVLLGFLWGGLGRVFLVHHATWSINSVCHLWGTRPFNSHDESRNNVIFGILGAATVVGAGRVPARDRWVTVTGVYRPGESVGGGLPELAASNVVEIPAPDDPYE